MMQPGKRFDGPAGDMGGAPKFQRVSELGQPAGWENSNQGFMQLLQACERELEDGGAGNAESCYFFKRGWCTKGASCKFSHDGVGGPGSHVPAEVPANNQFAIVPAAPGDQGQAMQAALLQQQALAGLAAQGGATGAADFSAAGGCNEAMQMQAALQHFQGMQMAFMAQVAQAQATSAAEVTDPLNAWAIALHSQGLLPSMQEAQQASQAATSSAGIDIASALQLRLLGGKGGGGEDRDRPIPATHQGKKLQMCNFFKSGKCTKGTNCPYAHGEEEVMAASLRAARVEAAMREGSKNDTCYDFRDSGKCRFGVSCKFSHNL